jgi:stalled ribosome alternative rescue factor ArfA
MKNAVFSDLRDELTRNRLRQKFFARGLASREESRQTGEYFEAKDVHAELRGMLNAAKLEQEKS